MFFINDFRIIIFFVCDDDWKETLNAFVNNVSSILISRFIRFLISIAY
jgi:hypothetical protein